MAELNLAAHLRERTEWAYHNLVNDLNAMDDDKASGSPDPALRPATKLVAECGTVNASLASLIATGATLQTTDEECEAYYAGITTRAEAVAALDAGTRKLYAAMEGVAPDGWGVTVPGFFGPTTLLAAAILAGQHMMYHDGQLNSVHLLHGDVEMHWK